MKRSLIVLFALAIVVLSTSAFAVTVPTVNSNNITANVTASCKWFTPLTVGFGAYDPFSGSPTTATTSVNFKCVKLTAAGDVYKIWFNKTAGSMSNGTDSLNYTLTDNSNVALPTVSGSATTVAGVAGVVGAGYSFTVKGSVAAGQDVTGGAYTDTVIANIEY